MALRDLFLPYQLRWLTDPAPMRLAEKSRQIGWTWMSAFEAVRECLTLPGLVNWYFTRDEELGKEFLEYCRPWWRSINAVSDALFTEPDFISGRSDVQTRQLRFPNQAKIHVLSSNPDAARGKSGNARIDELSSHLDQEAEYSVVEPITTWGGRLSIYSTHKGKCLFSELCEQAKGGGNPKGWSFHKVTVLDAVRDGLVKKINERRVARGMPAVADDDWLAEKKARCVSDLAWKQEYLCEPCEEAYTLFPWDLIRACEQPWELIRRAPTAKTGPVYFGFDVGRYRDLSVCWILERSEGCLWTRSVEVLADCPFVQQREIFSQLMSAWRPVRVCIDSTTIGIELAEWAVKTWGELTVFPVKVMNRQKEELFSGLYNALRSHFVWLPSDEEIRKDIHSIEKEVTPLGIVKYYAKATQGGHADRAFALALALAAAGDDPGKLMAARLQSERALRSGGQTDPRTYKPKKSGNWRY